MRTLTSANIGLRLVLCLALLAGTALARSFPASIDLSTLDGTNGIIFEGAEPGDEAGISVSDAGDVNNDGHEDFLIGAYFAAGQTTGTGVAYVVFGPVQDFPSPFELANLDGSDGFVLNGVNDFDLCGGAVAGGRDLNGDGIADIAIGAMQGDIPGPSGFDVGEVYVVYGSSSGFPASLDLGALDGTNGFVLRGFGPRGYVGASLDVAEDMNGDGLADLIIGAPFVDIGGMAAAGSAYVVYGSELGFPAEMSLGSLDGTNGFVMTGSGAAHNLGRRVHGAGDVNADGIADFVIGAPGVQRDGIVRAGEAYLVFGSDTGFPASFDRSYLDGSTGFALQGVGENGSAGWAVSDAGDVNDDGIADVLIAAPYTEVGGVPNIGACYVLFGSESAFPATILASSIDGTNGFTIVGDEVASSTALSVAAAGDVNDDGIDDIVLGAPSADPDGRNGAGQCFVVFGATGFPTEVSVASLDGSNGFTMNGINADSSAGIFVSGAGDMNGDGGADVLIGAYRFGAGETYLVFGLPSCARGTTNITQGLVLDSLYVQGLTGGSDRTIEMSASELIRVAMIEPGAGGNGKFVLHANIGLPEDGIRTELPFDIGATCFPFLLAEGANPLIIANNIGRTGLVGESHYRAVPWPDPERATTEFVYPALGQSMVLTFQALIVDPRSRSPRSVSVTNAVTVNVVP